MAFDIKINCFTKKLNGFFMYKKTLSGGKVLCSINNLLDTSLAFLLGSLTPPKKAA